MVHIDTGLKAFVVMSNYGSEGWSVILQTDDFKEAVERRELGLCNGSPTVIFRPCALVVAET